MMICRDCRAEVRFGWREGPGWWHREAVEHKAFPIVAPEVVEEVIELPEPEVGATPVDHKDERVPGGVRTVTNLLAKQDWSLRKLTYARGPRVGAKGGVLSISDTILLKAVDGSKFCVALWVDGKFDFGYVGEVKEGLIVPHPVNATELKNWIKGTYDLPAPVLEP